MSLLRFFARTAFLLAFCRPSAQITYLLEYQVEPRRYHATLCPDSFAGPWAHQGGGGYIKPLPGCKCFASAAAQLLDEMLMPPLVSFQATMFAQTVPEGWAGTLCVYRGPDWHCHAPFVDVQGQGAAHDSTRALAATGKHLSWPPSLDLGEL